MGQNYPRKQMLWKKPNVTASQNLRNVAQFLPSLYRRSFNDLQKKIILTLAIRSIRTCELEIPKRKYDPNVVPVAYNDAHRMPNRSSSICHTLAYLSCRLSSSIIAGLYPRNQSSNSLVIFFAASIFISFASCLVPMCAGMDQR